MSTSALLNLSQSVTVVVVHYQTPELLQQTVDSFREFYPSVPLLIVDNGSSGDSDAILTHYESEQESNTTVHREKENLFHGPALDKSARELVKTPFCFFLDSDTRTEKGGFLEEILQVLNEDPKNYAAGRQILANRRGFKDEAGFPILLTPYLMLKREDYPRFPPFIHHGQPGLQHFMEVQKAGFRIIDFPMHHYIHHIWRGTASKYGYRLGWRGKWDYLMNKLGWV